MKNKNVTSQQLLELILEFEPDSKITEESIEKKLTQADKNNLAQMVAKCLEGRQRIPEADYKILHAMAKEAAAARSKPLWPSLSERD